MSAVIDDYGLLAGILEDPADDARRLIYADWLAENGESARSEFIRIQIEIATLPEPTGDTPCEVDAKWKQRDDRFEALKQREMELLEGHWKSWFPNPEWAKITLCRNLFEQVSTADPYVDFAFRLSRGFVLSIELAHTALADHCREIFQSQPVERVTLTDARISNRNVPGGVPDWQIDFPDDNCGIFPNPKFLFMHQSEQTARDALSRMAVKLGRQQAGLPELAKGKSHDR